MCSWITKQSFEISLYLLTIITLIIHNSISFGNDTISTVHYSDGLIPLDYGKRPATDLFYKGELLLPDEADKLRRENLNFDLSEISLEEVRTYLRKAKRRKAPGPDDIPLEFLRK